VPPVVEIVDAGSISDRVIWRYTTDRPADDWFKTDFDAGNWEQGPGGFGTRNTPGAHVRTTWNTPDIWARRDITVPTGADPASLHLQVHHDEDAEIYLNGILAAKLSGFTTDYEMVEILPDALKVLKPDKNTLAVHCHQTTGGQYIDVRLARLRPQTTAAIGDRP